MTVSNNFDCQIFQCIFSIYVLSVPSVTDCALQVLNRAPDKRGGGGGGGIEDNSKKISLISQ